MAGALALIGAWTGAFVAMLMLVFYLLALRLTRCRVQTKQDTPCRWLVRGVLGTCEWHHGLKHGLPLLVRVPRSVLPVLMWHRQDVVAAENANDPQPSVAAGHASEMTPAAARAAYDWAMLALQCLGVLVAVLSLAHQVTA